MNVHATLVAARALIADPAHWCQGDFAQDINGMGVSALSEQAKCRCSLGALGCAAGIDPNGFSMDLAQPISLLDHAALTLVEEEDGGYVGIVELNDGEYTAGKMDPHQAVLTAFDMAIANAPA